MKTFITSLIILLCSAVTSQAVILGYRFNVVLADSDATGSTVGEGYIYVDQGALLVGTFDENDVVQFSFTSGSLNIPSLADLNSFTFDVETSLDLVYTSSLSDVSYTIDTISMSFTETINSGLVSDSYSVTLGGAGNLVTGTSIVRDSTAFNLMTLMFDPTITFDSDINSGEAATIPEPSTALPILACAGALFLVRRKKQRKA